MDAYPDFRPRPSHAAVASQVCKRVAWIDAAADAELQEFGDVQAAAPGFGSSHPPLSLTDFAGELPLRETRFLPHHTEKRRHPPVNQCGIGLRHRQRLSAAVALKRFSHISLDAETASTDNTGPKCIKTGKTLISAEEAW